MNLTPDLLKTFVAAAQTQNFTQAAQKVSLTQSAVSHQIRKLEMELGKPLFERVPHGVTLTRHGKSLLKYANQLIRLHDEAIATFSESHIKGQITLGTTEEYATLYFPRILKRFAEKYPLVQVNLHCDRSDSLRKMLKQGKLELCLRNTATIGTDAVFLRKEPLVWVGAHDAEPERESPLPLAMFNEECINRQWAIEALEKNSIRYRIAYSSPSISGIVAAVQSGLAIAPIGASTFTPNLRVISSDKLPVLPSANICLYHPPYDESSIQSNLIKHIINEFSDLSLLPPQNL